MANFYMTPLIAILSATISGALDIVIRILVVIVLCMLIRRWRKQ